MSLDVYLEADDTFVVTEPTIYVRENGRTVSLSRAEWEARYPGREPYITSAGAVSVSQTVWQGNVTHNLNKMAMELGAYEAVWRPDENGIERAFQVIPTLEHAIQVMLLTPSRFEKFNPENGWGSFEVLLQFFREYLAACQEFPQARVSVWR